MKLIKHTHYYKLVLLYLGLLFIYACSGNKTSKEDEINKKTFVAEKNEVETVILKNQSFQKELVSNGKLIASQKNILQFKVGEKLERLYVKNGDLVQKGKILATLNAFTYQQALTKAEINLTKAKLEFQDKLIGRGYDTFNKDSIPKKEYNMLAIRSGYKDALHELENARAELKSTKLIAPFRGKVANISNKQFEYISAGQDFMTLINDAVFEVEFYLIESEIKDITINDKIQIAPFALDKNYDGRIITINPLVEKDGTILVKAKVKNGGQLMEGMNVKVRIQKEIKNQWVVPKSAVILRQNQEVLFKVIQGKAYWTYVQTTKENSNEYAVIPHPDKSSAVLNSGDTIIVSGNLNLAHDSEVLIKSKSTNKE